jgi:hypothetical protein
VFSPGISEVASGRMGRRDSLEENVAHVAQLVEHVLGKDEVIGSNPIVGSSIRMNGADAGWELSRTRSSEITKLGKQTGGEHGQR